MRSKQALAVVGLAVLGFFGFGFVNESHAVQAGLQMGYSFPKPAGDYDGSGFLLGGELTSSFGPLLLGAFYEHTAFELASGAKIPTHFYGAVARLKLAAIPLFVDAKAGPTYSSDSDTQIGYGLGVGYDFSFIPGITLAPRLGYRKLPRQLGDVEQSLSSLDFTILIALGF